MPSIPVCQQLYSLFFRRTGLEGHVAALVVDLSLQHLSVAPEAASQLTGGLVLGGLQPHQGSSSPGFSGPRGWVRFYRTRPYETLSKPIRYQTRLFNWKVHNKEWIFHPLSEDIGYMVNKAFISKYMNPVTMFQSCKANFWPVSKWDQNKSH